MRLIDVLTEEERVLTRRIAKLHAEARNLEYQNSRKRDALSKLNRDIEHAEQSKSQRRENRSTWTGIGPNTKNWTKAMITSGKY